jgi:hypothetical protein
MNKREWRKNLEIIKTYSNAFYDTNDGLDTEEISQLRERAEACGVNICQTYYEVLKIRNGFNDLGLLLLGDESKTCDSFDIVDANCDKSEYYYHTNDGKLVLYGMQDIDLYVYNKESKRYEIVSIDDTDTVYETYESMEELLEGILKECADACKEILDEQEK